MKILYKKTNFKKVGFSTMAFYGQDIVMAFLPPEYCRLFAQKKAHQGGVTGTPGPPPPSYTPVLANNNDEKIIIIIIIITSIIKNYYKL